MMNAYIQDFNTIGISDVAIIGGKNASLAEMFNKLVPKGVNVPDGFATTAFAFSEFLNYNSLQVPLNDLMHSLDRDNFVNLKEIGEKARMLILKGVMPQKISDAIISAYEKKFPAPNTAVAVRSSATAEDLPEASFAGQHESYLNVKGSKAVLKAIQKCFASLYTDRAIKYREDNHFSHQKVLLSVGIQEMVRSDKGSAGVAFTLEPESGFRDIIHISGIWGLGENIVQGAVTPDEYFVFKPTLRLGKQAIIQKKLGDKLKTMVYSDDEDSMVPVFNTDTPREKQKQFVLNNQEVTNLANWCLLIEEHYGKPMDIEWARDGISGKMYIVQARPETVHSQNNSLFITEYQLLEKGEQLAEGNAIGTKVVTGVARVLSSEKDSEKLNSGEILVTDITSPDWDPVLKKSAGIITNKGGRTSHASIVARELGVPAIVGCGNATETIMSGEIITLSCCEGKTGHVYRGALKSKAINIDLTKINMPSSTEVMLIVGDPEQAFRLSFYPNDGIGLMRIEFIISHFIQVHPMALAKFSELKDEETKKKIQELTTEYPDKGQFFVDKLAQGIATIAAAFYPKDVIVRMSDFKTNEYANLVGGRQFEPEEENPMLGFRGASRYYNDNYKEGFKLECAAIKEVRENMGLSNVKVMIPFCRTPEEGGKVLSIMSDYGLNRWQDDTLEIFMMVEIPSNVLQAEEFASLFDGFSIGSNDLTQLILGVDRDSVIINNIFSEQNTSVKRMISSVIQKAKGAGVKIGLCGQAPSDYPAFAGFLVSAGINSISFNPDAVLKGIENINKAEKDILIPLETTGLGEGEES
jgi:pyruvate, water dikinase